MVSIGSQTIVVGIDGSGNSDAALKWAVDEASARGLHLHVFSAATCQAYRAASVASGAVASAAVAREALEAALARLGAAEASAVRSAPGLVVTTASGLDSADATLVELSARAHSIVLGRSGHRPLSGAVLGAVAWKVVTHAQCPVVVVQESSAEPRAQRGVAVGVDRSAGCEPALAHAFEQASVRRVPLHVIHAWWTRATAGRTPYTQADQIAQERLSLAEVLAGWSEKYPDVEVRVSIPVGPTVLAITDAARGAELLVMGSRGHGSFLNLLLGSVSQGVLRHAICPVVVVPTRIPDRAIG